MENEYKYLEGIFDGEPEAEPEASAAYDGNAYCDFSAAAAKAIAGKDIMLGIWSADGSTILAISGQKSLKINRSADTIEISTKDSDGGWKAYLAGQKEWSIETDGVYARNDESHHILSEAFDNSDPVCLKVYDRKNAKGMFGGLAVITDYPIEAPFDDSVSYSLTFMGMGKLTDLTDETPESDDIPE